MNGRANERRGVMQSRAWIDLALVTGLVAAVLGIAGCGDEPTTADTKRTLRLELDDFTVPPGGEGLVCQTFASALGAQVEVTAWTSTLSRGGHHMLVFPAPGAKDAPLAPCGGNDGQNAPIFQGQKTGVQTLTYPEGVAALIAEDTGLIVQIHYANPSADPITVHNAVELTLADPGVSYTHLAPLQFDNFDISVPPGGVPTIVSKTCTIADDIDIVWLVSHSHSHAIAVAAKVGDAPLYETSSPQEPPMEVFEPPRRVKKGEAITYGCTYVNGSAQEIGWGTSLEKDEMCVMVGAYVDASGDAARLRCEDDSGGCLSCLQAITQQKPERLCTDDGPPSSKEIYDDFQACACDASPAGCFAACSDSVCGGAGPTEACRDCLDTTCAVQGKACFSGG